MNNFYINQKVYHVRKPFSNVVNPKGLKKDEYDEIIIGAGIGGLTGCYLAKAGMIYHE